MEYKTFCVDLGECGIRITIRATSKEEALARMKNEFYQAWGTVLNVDDCYELHKMKEI